MSELGRKTVGDWAAFLLSDGTTIILRAMVAYRFEDNRAGDRVALPDLTAAMMA